jgi:XapX domain-containing protein
MRRLPANPLVSPILQRVPMQPVMRGTETSGTFQYWVILGYGSWGAIVSRFDWVVPGGLEMKVLMLSFAVGLGVGVIYGLIRVKSPAPPIVALLGLLGMVFGEQLGIWIQAKKLDLSRAASVCLVGERYDRQHSPMAKEFAERQ